MSTLKQLLGEVTGEVTIQKKTILKIKKYKENLLSPCNDYLQKYKDEIENGDQIITLLLEEGKKNGLSQEQTLKQAFYGKEIFIPTSQTPILNFLYYSMRELEKIDKDYKLLNENKKIEDNQHAVKFYNKEDKFGVEKLEDITKLMFNGIDVETFNKIKKLKKLSKSSNENEAFQSYRKCNELCKKYNLEFDKIPN